MPTSFIASLGPFDVFEVLGTGGMGVVRRGVHRATGLPVAVKVLHADHARDPDFLASFRAEVRAVASLHHPSVIAVLDHGLIDELAAVSSGGKLPGGSPYLVMELMGGRLSSTPYPWGELRSILMGLLDALAHAHARGVLHRDIKRGNVLLVDATGPHRGLRLTDFGIAHLSDTLHEDGVYGSPSYMAPEQCTGEWRDHGPWTDLYGVGCLAWALSTGEPPFSGSYPRLLEAHLYDEPPPFIPRMDVPAGFESWLRRLLSKHPAGRPRHAAAAAAQLRDLKAPVSSPNPTRRPDLAEPVEAEDVSISDRATRPVESVTRRFALTERQESLRLEEPEAAPTPPPDWRRHRPPPRPMNLIGAGLGLYGLRPVPLAGRESERDRLWAALSTVVEEKRAGFVLIRGAAGRGKSRLMEWLARRAHECGVATVWRAVHGPVSGPIDGMGPMLARALRCHGLAVSDLEQRVGRLLPADADDYERNALVELMSPGTGKVRFSNPVERHVVLRRALERAAGQGPVILCLDDVQWGLDALGFTDHLMRWQSGSPSPVLVVATLRSEALEAGSLEQLQLDELLRRRHVEEIELPPLPERDHAELVGGLLGLSGMLASEVRRRTAGNPLFATQLVGDWVRRGVLVPGPHGFVLQGDAAADIPDDIHAVWVRRLERTTDAAGIDAVEIAAALGQNVGRLEWWAACEGAGVELPNGLLDDLAAEGLVRVDESGFEWVHGMLRESLERWSKERGTWARWNRACAAMVRKELRPEGHERLGLHLLAAGEVDAALEPLLQGARHLRRISEMARGMRLLDRREAALRALDIPETDERWGLGWTVRSGIHNLLGQTEEARAWGEKAVAAGRANQWVEALATGLVRASWGPFWAGDLVKAREMVEEALALYEDLDEPAQEGAAHLSMAFIALFEKKLDEARAWSASGEAVHKRGGNAIGAAEAFRLQSTIERLDGRHERAIAVSREVISRNIALGNRLGVADGHNELAETARHLGRFEEAEAHYREALAIYEERGSRLAEIMRTNLSLVMLSDGRLVEAEAMLASLPSELDVRASWLLACVVGFCRMVVAAATANWSAWDREQARLDDIARLGAAFDDDTEWAAGRAAEIAEEAGEHARAEAVRRVLTALREPVD